RRVRVPGPGAHRSHPIERDRCGQGSGCLRSVSRRRRRRISRPRRRPAGPPHSSQREGGPGRARGRGSARVHRTRGSCAGGGVRIARRQAPRRFQAAGEVTTSTKGTKGTKDAKKTNRSFSWLRGFRVFVVKRSPTSRLLISCEI